MISLFNRATERKRRSRKFVSRWTSQVDGGLLEAKSLTAPLLFNQPPGAPGRLRAAFAQVVGATGQSNMNNASLATAGYLDVVTNFGSTQMTVSGNAQSSWIDSDDPAPPSAPVGNPTITANTYQSIGMDCGGGFIPNLADTMNTIANGSRNYTLADDSSSPTGPVTLVEHYDVMYSPPAGTIATNTIVLTGMTSPSVNAIGVGGGNIGLNNLAINGTMVGIPSTGSVVIGGSTVNWTATSVAVHVQMSTTFTVLPSTAGINPPVGVAWGVTFASRLQTTAVSNPGQVDLMELTTHYDASF